MFSLAAWFLLVAVAPAAIAAEAPQDAESRPVELGKVRFLRSVDDGLARARAEGKPAFVLFQEVPGCSTCTGFGRGPLSEDLFVEAIETLFVPVAIYNNGGGSDARALERFSEPAWNNPVVRFLAGHGKDLLARRDGIWTSAALAPRMTGALLAAKQTIPPWWTLAELDARSAELPRAVFAMHCFWVGQARLGALDGVADARPAFLGGLEVVEVRYDPARLPLSDLIAAAIKAGVADRIWVEGDADLEIARARMSEQARKLSAPMKLAPDSDDLRSLKASPWASLRAPRAQAVRINGRLAAGDDSVETLLSPRQRERSTKK